MQDLRVVIFRPGMLYGGGRHVVLPIAYATLVSHYVLTPLKRFMPSWLHFLADKPLRVETVAIAAVNACLDESVEGVHEVADIERIAKKDSNFLLNT